MFVLALFLALSFCASSLAAITVTVSGPGGSGSAVLPDAGGTFEVDLPLTRNAVNPITVTATDGSGQTRSAEVAITQLSLDQVVVSRITTERLSTEEVEQLVQDGVIDLADPENFNVSQFSIVLTLDKEEIPITLPIAFPIGEKDPSGWETYKRPDPDDANRSKPPPPPPPEIIVFVQEFSERGPGEPTPPPIPGVIIIEGRIRSLKEFFNVRLLLLNTSGIFTLSDVLAELEFPDGGLSHVLPADGIVSFGDILPGTPDQPGALEREFIIRGDAIGVKGVRVNFGGTVTGPGIPADDPVPFNGSAESSVEVLGPPAFEVTVIHPDEVTAGEPYELTVEILNAGELPALYASLELDVSADARLADCTVNEVTGDIDCEYVDEPVVQSLGHIDPGERVRLTYTVLPSESGRITSCVGGSDQNITLEVVVGNLGCAVGHYPPDIGAPEGIPTVNVVPVNNTQGVSIDSPVVAFFSELMNHNTITTGSNGTFNVVDAANELVPGQIRFETNLSGRTIAIFQVSDGVLNRWRGGEEYTVYLNNDIRDRDGQSLFNEWVSTFRTTTAGVGDFDPPQVTLSIEPPVNPNYVLPGELVTVRAFASDQGSGVARVEMRIKDLDGTNLLYTLVDQKSVFQGDQPPFRFTLNSANLVTGHTYQVLVTAYDGNGNAGNSTLALILAPNADPPVIVLPDDPALPILEGVSVLLRPVALTGGVRQVRYYLDGAASPYKTVTLPPWQGGLSTLSLGLSNHTIRAVAEDGLGQTGEDFYTFTIISNPSLPVVSFPGSVDGEVHVMGSTFTVDPDVTDEVGLESVRVYLVGSPTNLLATTADPITLRTTNLTLGAHRVLVIATNLLGRSNLPDDPDSYLEFEIVAAPTGAPPAAPILTGVSAPSNGYVTVTGTTSNRANVTVVNLDLGITANGVADGGGGFAVALEAVPGHTLRITATDLSASPDPSPAVEVIVPAAPVLLGIEVRPASFTLGAPGAYRQIAVWGSYDTGDTNDITGQASFASDALGIASVNSAGKVAAVSRGNAVITASVFADGTNHVAASDVFVDIVTLTGITVSPPSVSLISPAQTQSLAVTGFYNNGTSQLLGSGNVFVSGDPSVATVSGAGVVTAVADGLTQVSVYRGGLTPVAVPVSVNTGSDPLPTATILSPADGASAEPREVVAVSVRAQDLTAGVTRVELMVTGATAFAASRQIATTARDTTQVFNFTVASNAPVGSAIHVLAWAIDTSGNPSPTNRILLNVVDASAPRVEILDPVPGNSFGYGDPLPVTVRVADLTGVTQVWVYTTGALALSEVRPVAPPATASNLVFDFTVPFGVPYPEVTIHAEAWDTLGFRGLAIPAPVTIDDADTTPPATRIVSVSDPGAGTAATVTYEVTDGLDDLDHVAIYVRRDGFGTFFRYTDADGGNPMGEYTPQSGASGTLTFDTTKMGGDGTWEFYSVGVDLYGNREAAPTGGPDRVRGFAAGTVWTVINTDTNLDAGNTAFDNRNLRIDGATVTLSGHHDFHNLELINGAVLTHPQTTASEAHALDFTAWTITVDSNSTIDVNARGYPGGNREGNGNSYGLTDGFAPGSTYRSGGSYGGSGGAVEGTPCALYGNLVSPAELGSGGSYGGGATPGGDGGGRVQVHAVNLVLDGVLAANGGNGQGSSAGSGSGGAVYLVVSTLSGVGAVSADGGAFQVGGGGGRIAVHFADMATYDAGLLSALGGDGSSRDGGNGTVYLKSLGEGGGTLIVDGQGTATGFSTLPIPPGWVFDNIVLRNSARVVADTALVVSNTLSIETGSILTHSLSQTNGLTVTAARIEIDGTSSIDVSAKGYRGGNNSGNPNSYGYTLGEQPGSTYRSGGSYGGLGGVEEGVEGPAYGHPANPIYLGSGGSYGGGSDPGGNGGGRVTLTASEALVVDGTILAEGQQGSGSSAGSGSGGSIKIDAALLRGTGTISANGGAYQVGGGGGRIAIVYDYLGLAGDNLGGTSNITARGGQGTRHGSAGTLLLRRRDQTVGHLVIDNVTEGVTAAKWSPLTHVGFGTIAWLTNDTLVTDGKVRLLPGGLVGLELNPNLDQAVTFTVVGNTATSITVDVSGGTNLLDVASTGDTYAAVYRFDDVTLRRGGYLVMGDNLTVSGTMAVEPYGKVTHYDATTVFRSRIDLTAGALLVRTNGMISADARGYPGGNREGNAQSYGLTTNFSPGATFRSGGSYGGLGGREEGTSNPTYGSLTQPADLGSGGSYGGGSDPGGDGGGWIDIVVGVMRVDGVVSANGAEGTGSSAGSGSGGSIAIDTGVLEGDGVITANGGVFQVAGGGGRIAIRYDTLAMTNANLHCTGGQGSSGRNGGNGTIYLKKTGQAWGDLIVDGRGAATPEDSTPLPGGYVFDDLILRNAAEVVADDGLSVSNLLSVQSGSILTHTLRHEPGLVIDAKRIEVLPTASIDVSGKGYRGGHRDGWTYTEGETLGGLQGSTYRSGGSYGGLGARNEGVRNQAYGDPHDPVHLGSGGSGGGGSEEGGHGGGRVTLTVAEDLAVDGAIRADGDPGDGSDAGSGSGGAINIVVGTLRGSGAISANGGSYQVPGGGGRVFIDYATLGGTNDDLDSLRSVTALGGRSDTRPGSAGTVVFRQPGQTWGDLVIDNAHTNETAKAWTPLTHVGFGRSADLTASTLTTDGRVAILPNALVGLELNPNLSQDMRFAIVGNTATTIIVDVSGGASLADVAAAGDEYAAVFQFDQATVTRGGFLVMGDVLEVRDTLTVEDFGRITHYDATATFDSRLEARAGSVFVDSTATVDVTARGYPGGNREGNGQSWGLTLNHQPGSTYRSGGSYGGLGRNDDGQAGQVYGHASAPLHLGSGGSYGGGATPGGDGGGRIHLVATNEVRIDGAVHADGAPGQGSSAGSGSGGSVFIETPRLRGIGWITADGGAYQVPGGGGRVAVFHDSLGGSGDDLGDLRQITAWGGHNGSSVGSAGTVLLKKTGQARGDLVIDDGYSNQTATAWTPLTPVGFGTNRGVAADTLVLDGRMRVVPGGLVGQSINPNLAQDEVFTIVGNNATQVMVDVTGGTLLTDIASAGDPYGGVHRFDNLTLRRGGFLVVGDRLVIDGRADLDEFGVLTHFDATASFDSRLELYAGSVAIGTSAAINVTARGYPGGNREGNGNSYGLTTNFLPGSTYRSGGSYGGLGAAVEGTPNPVYGSATRPAALGSGGSYGGGAVPGGDGGGWVYLHCATLTVDGVISADGGTGQGSSAGSGSGGSILIEVSVLSGGGGIRAAGGAYQVGGGGGRVAVYFDAGASATGALAIASPPGIGSSGSGSAGSVHLDDGFAYVPFSLGRDAGDTAAALGGQPVIVRIVPGPDAPGIQWKDGGSGADYQVDFATSLEDPDWAPVFGSMTGQVWTGAVPGAPERGYLRIRRR